MFTKRASKSLLILAAAAVAATVTGAATPVRAAEPVELPATAITEDTALVIWFDAAHFTPEALRTAVEQINAALPDEMQATRDQLDAQLDEGMAEFGQGHAAFTGAGGEGMLMLMRAPENDVAPPPSMLVRVAPGTTPEQLDEAMREFTEGPDGRLTAYNDRWLVDADEQANVPTDGTEAEARAFEELLAQTDEAPIRMGFRMNETLRNQIAQIHEQMQGGQQGQMGLNPGAELLGPVQEVEGAWATVTFGENPAFAPVFRFRNDQSAEQFRELWSQMLMMGQQMFQMQFAHAPEPPAPEAIQGLFQALELQRDGQQLRGHIGGEFITHLGEIAPAIEPLIAHMLMGGMGGQPPAQQPPQPPMQ